MVSLRDISARRVFEEQLRHAAKMEAVGKLTAGIAHDFNNLLTVIIGNLDLALRAAKASAPSVKLLDNAMYGAKRAALLTERLLAFARRKPLEPRPIDAGALVAGMSDMLQQTLGEKVVPQIVPAQCPLPVEVDPTELEAAILNLAVNARDAMPSGGHFIVRTMNADLAAGPGVAEGSHVLISVSDTGTGMDADVLSQAFEPFFTTKREGQGTGLGLSHVYGFVRQSGGQVEIESKPGAGTTVKIYLPQLVDAHEAAVQSAGGNPELERLPEGAGETVLVVEDNDSVRALATTCLRQLGYRALEARDGHSAIAIIDKESELALLLTDLGLPGVLDGRAVAEYAHRERPALPVLFMTAYAAASLVHDGRLDSGVALLNKPFTPSALARRVHEILSQNRRPMRVLVIDDEPIIRMFIADVLASFGCSTEEAGTGAEALRKYQSARFDAAIIDVGLPDLRGDEIVAEIRKSDPEFPIALATGYANARELASFKTDPKLAIVGKPFEPEQLTDALRRIGLNIQCGSTPESQR